MENSVSIHWINGFEKNKTAAYSEPFHFFQDLIGSTVRGTTTLGAIFHCQQREGFNLKNLLFDLSGFIKCSKENLIELQVHK